jgi:hypothetical protein
VVLYLHLGDLGAPVRPHQPRAGQGEMVARGDSARREVLVDAAMKEA